MEEKQELQSHTNPVSAGCLSVSRGSCLESELQLQTIDNASLEKSAVPSAESVVGLFSLTILLGEFSRGHFYDAGLTAAP